VRSSKDAEKAKTTSGFKGREGDIDRDRDKLHCPVVVLEVAVVVVVVVHVAHHTPTHSGK
jgi:hypothetical protein